ncbi:spore germination lipoprotein GerD [Paenibacillus sp. GXUN7292]|uniref:spore germination lipoprotein GerD n=1 Tax=Paenibacillus sp. GXUN7292 TaxID=3422499 RepID=UPI003D7EE335
MMRVRWMLLLILTIFTMLVAGCGSEPSNNSQQTSYKDMKSMVIDILKTEDAQKALQQSSEQMSGYSAHSSKLLSIQDQEEVRLAVKDVISSPDYDKVIKKLMTDTRFAGEFAKAVNKENKDIHKELIKDPQYQAEMIKTLKTPEMDKLILEVLKSTQYRKELMSIMQDAMQNPIFRLELLDLMKTAVKEELQVKPDEKVKKQQEGQQGQGGQGQGEGEGEDSNMEQSEDQQ